MRTNPQNWSIVSFIIAVFSVMAISNHNLDAHDVMSFQKSVPSISTCNAGDRIFDISISPDDRFVLASNWRSNIKENWKTRVWSLETGNVVYDLDLHDLDSTYTLSDTATFSPDGKYILVSVANGAWMWSTKTGMPIQKLLGDVSSSEGLKFRFIHNGKEVVIAGNRGVEVWDSESG
ncbi:MAG: hypothetical protein ABI970_11435, partial [Chloroflexota bacterium]